MLYEVTSREITESIGLRIGPHMGRGGSVELRCSLGGVLRDWGLVGVSVAL